MQRIDLRAAVRIRVRVGVVASLRVGFPVPRVAVANNLRGGHVYGMVDGQVKGVDLRATMVIHMREGVVS